MPIEGRTPRSCFDQFRDHMAAVVDKIIPSCQPLRYRTTQAEHLCTLAFEPRNRIPAVSLATKFGEIYLQISQELEASKVDKSTYRLRTKRYQYKLYAAGNLAGDAALRWEYEAVEDKSQVHYPRHHLQVGRVESQALTIPMSSGVLDLNRVHMPTGWVTMEEVFRFLITDLNIKPPCAADWPSVLAESEETFFQKFTSKRR